MQSSLIEVSEDDLLSAVTADNINAQGIMTVPPAEGNTVLHTPAGSDTAQVCYTSYNRNTAAEHLR